MFNPCNIPTVYKSSLLLCLFNTWPSLDHCKNYIVCTYVQYQLRSEKCTIDTDKHSTSKHQLAESGAKGERRKTQAPQPTRPNEEVQTEEPKALSREQPAAGQGEDLKEHVSNGTVQWPKPVEAKDCEGGAKHHTHLYKVDLSSARTDVVSCGKTTQREIRTERHRRDGRKTTASKKAGQT